MFDDDNEGGVGTVFVLVLICVAILGGATWMVLNRPVARRADVNDRASARLLAASALVVAIGLVYGLGDFR